MPTRRFAGLVVGAGTLFSIGTNIQSGWLLVLSSLLLGCAIAGYALSALMVRGIEIVRHAPAEVFQGASVAAGLEVANTGRGMKLSIVLEDDHLAPATLLVPSLRPGDRVGLVSRRVALRRGAQASAAIRVSSRAPFGVARASRALRVPAHTVVFPAVASLPELPVGGGAASSDPAARLRSLRGTGQEYLGIREYRVGDSMRHVHWPSTARTGSVMVREFEQQQLRRVLIVVDTLADVEPDPLPRIVPLSTGDDAVGPPPRPDRPRRSERPWRTPLDLCCAAGGSVALEAMRAGHPTRLAAARGGAAEVLEGTDPTRVLSWLAELGPGGGMPLDALAGELYTDARGASVLVACPAWRANEADRLVSSLARVRSVAAEVVVALVGTAGFAGRPTAETLSSADIERTTAALTRAGIGVIPIEAGTDLATAFEGSMRSTG